MTDKEMWEAYRLINADLPERVSSFQYGVEADHLADLTLKGIKTATTSGHVFYVLEEEPLPEAGSYDVVLDSKDQAVCIIKTNHVYLTPFQEVSASHAAREGEGDKSLTYWRQVHQDVFSQWLAEVDLDFHDQMLVVCEEFEVVYPN